MISYLGNWAFFVLVLARIKPPIVFFWWRKSKSIKDLLQGSKCNALRVNMYQFFYLRNTGIFSSWTLSLKTSISVAASFHGSSTLVYSSYNLWNWSLRKGCLFGELEWSWSFKVPLLITIIIWVSLLGCYDHHSMFTIPA